MVGMTYLRGKRAARNMKLAQIDYLSPTGRPKSKPSTVDGQEERGKKKQIDFLFVPPLGEIR